MGMVTKAGRAALAGLAIAGAGAPAMAQQLFKCGASYQDRPCPDREVQKRYSAGRFDVDQVNHDTDKDCARLAGEVMPYWSRLHQGEPLEAVQAEYDRKPVARQDKSAMRDLFIALKGIDGPPTRARGQLETQCMAYKRRNGLPTERALQDQAAGAGASSAAAIASDRSSAGELAAQRRSAAAAERAALAAQRRAEAEALRARTVR